MKDNGKSLLLAAVLVVGTTAAHANVIVKANNTDALNLPTSWINGVVPGTNDIVQWDYNVTSGQTYSLGTNLAWQGIVVASTCSNGFTLGSGYTLTLGSAGLVIVPNKSFTFSCTLALACDQTWSVANNTSIPQGGVNLNGYTLSLSGGGAKQFKCTVTGGGQLVNLGSGAIKFTNAGAAAPATDVVLNGANLTFETSTGLAAGPRTQSLTLNNGASLSLGGRSSANTIETNANALTLGPGATSSLTIAPNAAKNAQFYSGSFQRATGSGTLLVVGNNLGSYSLASLTANSANLVLGTAPALLGAGGAAGSTACSVLPGVYGDTNGSGGGMGFTTYDTTYGLRPLNLAAEYAATLTSGQSQLDNVRLTNSANVVLTNTLTAATTINALSLVADPAFDLTHGMRIDGPGVLKLNSGQIYAALNASSTSAVNSITLDCAALDLNGQEGVFFTRGMGAQGGGSHSGAALDIACSITNDGGLGVTFSGNVIKLSGSATNRYTGDTRGAGGLLWLAKNGTSLPGNLVACGASVQNTGNQVADNCDVTVTSGTYNQRGGDWNSGSGASETFRNLFMTGGAYSDGADGTSSGKTYLTNAWLAGGAWTVTQGHSTELGGALALAGGTITIKRANDTTRPTTLTLRGPTVISNTTSGAYAPLTLGGGSAVNIVGGRVVLSNDLTCIGSALNTNPVQIVASVPTSGGGWPTLQVGGTRVFNVTDGAADPDLRIGAFLTNNNACAGGLVKRESGTLELAGTNGYSLATTVEAGTLLLSGTTLSPTTVRAGAVLAGAGVIDLGTSAALTVDAGGMVSVGPTDAIGTLTVNGDATFGDGAVLRVDVCGTTADRLAVSGSVAVADGVVSVEAIGAGTAPWCILTASEITGSFRSATSGLAVSRRANNTELWLVKNLGTLVAIH